MIENVTKVKQNVSKRVSIILLFRVSQEVVAGTRAGAAKHQHAGINGDGRAARHRQLRWAAPRWQLWSLKHKLEAKT